MLKILISLVIVYDHVVFSTGLFFSGIGVCTKNQEISINGTTSLQTVHICCKGYKPDTGKNLCTPICTRMCIHGYCTAPDTCTCKAGYAKDARNKYMCNAICSQGCANGFCASPEVCRCNNGYAPNPENANKCTKLCTTRRGDKSGNCSCDKGYTLLENNFCAANCNRGCINADCTAPESCTCWKGYARDAKDKRQCNPMCRDVDCGDGLCIGPNECSCAQGFVKGGNNTCVELQSDGTTTTEAEIQPETQTEINPTTEIIETTQMVEIDVTCEAPCVNADCIQGKCICHNGYTSQNSSNICEVMSVSGITTTSTPTTSATSLTTQTTPGLLIVSTNNPNKICTNGICKTPTSTFDTCDEGYNLQNGTCEPICDESCINGECTAPNICTCFDNFTINPSNWFECEPSCDFQCLNGICEQGLCKCNQGYQLDDDNRTCSIVSCDKLCVNGDCTGKNKGELPEQCKKVCDLGYELQEDNVTCKPICSTCYNGECVAPDTCKCLEGYLPDDTGSCKPSCQDGCINSDCTGPNICTCHLGYTFNLENVNQCDPICSEPCKNGDCTGPETCSCSPGFIPDETNKYQCKPITNCLEGYLPDETGSETACKEQQPPKTECSRPCVNADCIPGDLCMCKPGYTHDLEDNHLCTPLCSEPCQNGNCTAPETCTCNAGYFQSPQSIYQCDPICTKSCINSKCTAPDVCSCNNGLDPDPSDKFACIVSCSKPCINGVCSAKDTCTCNSGYTKDLFNKMRCNPICQNMCINGQCTAPETCTCRNRYALDAENKYLCKPVCAEPCINGICVGPNICGCGVGFKKTGKTMCVPVCSKPCVNGKCSGANVCSCDAGFRLDENDSFKCVPGEAPATQSPQPTKPVVTQRPMQPNRPTRPAVTQEPMQPNKPNKPVDNCLAGMVYNDELNRCIPARPCPQGCGNGTCDDGTCICNVGFMGEQCESQISEITAAMSSMWMTVGIVAGVAAIGGMTGYVGYTLRKNWQVPPIGPDVEKSENNIPVESYVREDGHRHIPVWGQQEVVVTRR